MTFRTRLTMALLCLIACAPLSGCAWCRGMLGPPDPFGPRAPCALAPGASADEIVAYLNQNAARMPAWRSSSVNISARGPGTIPMSVNATLAVESPRNFRLRAESTFGPEVDLGSNDQQFWFWERRAKEKVVLTAYHNESGRFRRFPIPFQPDWVMEAMGVIPIDPASVTLESGSPGSRTARLVSEGVSPQGETVKKVIVVDTCHGVVRAHELYDTSGRLLARAQLSNPMRYGPSQAVLPSRIDLDWPQAQLGLTMVIRSVNVNPPSIPESAWQMPNFGPNYEVIDLSE